jgi:hypothetical protein
MQTDPSFTDGRSAILAPLVECLNISGSSYEYLSDTIDREAREIEHMDADGSPLGSDTREGFEKGTINLQLTLASDTIPRPSYVIKLNIGNGDEYFIAGKFGRARTRNDIVKGALVVKKAYNPIVTTTLSEDFGQMKSFTQAAGSLSGTLASALSYVNTRTGATLAWSLGAAAGYTLPSWLSINASTGALSGTAVAGTFIFDVILTDTLSGQETRRGFGRVRLVIT